ncbi:MAG TPA: flagellar protein FlaG [Rhodocyclaceae bacterium]
MAITSLGSVSSANVSPTQGGDTAPRAAAPGAAQTPAAAVSQQSPPSKQAVEQAVKEIKQSMATMTSRDLQFSIDSDTKQTVVRVVDSQTGNVIRQIPAQELIDIAKAMDRAKGLLLRQEA